MSMLWTKKLKDYAVFLIPHPLLLFCHITNRTMDSILVIPRLYIPKDYPPGFICFTFRQTFFTASTSNPTAIGITYDFSATQIHNRYQISPSFFLYMDIGNVCIPFSMDSFCIKITF